jgi:hypothetical protein
MIAAVSMRPRYPCPRERLLLARVGAEVFKLILDYRFAGSDAIHDASNARIELNSPSNKSHEICPLRRSVQSQTESPFLKFPRNDWVLVWEADIPGGS